MLKSRNLSFAKYPLLLISIIILSYLFYYFYIQNFYSGWSSGPGGPVCISTPGFLCQSQILNTNGRLSLVVGQDTGNTLYNVQLACDIAGSTNGLPAAGNHAFVNVSLLGANSTLTNGETGKVEGLICYSYKTVANFSAGSNFVGLLWINYTSNSTTPSPINPYHTILMSHFTVAVN